MGRTYISLLQGNLTDAQASLRAIVKSLDPASRIGAFSEALRKLDQQPTTPNAKRPDKAEAVFNLAKSIVETCFPKYAAMAVAAGNVVDAFK